MNSEQFDRFLQDATLKVHEEWRDAGGRALTIEELYELNDLLDAFFQARKVIWHKR